MLMTAGRMNYRRTGKPEFLEVRPVLIDMLGFIENKSREPEIKQVAETLGARMRNLKAFEG